MKQRRTLILVIVLGMVALGVTGYHFRNDLAGWVREGFASAIVARLPGAHPSTIPKSTAIPQPLVASGTIEAHTVSVSSPQGGRLAVVRVKEGDRLEPGAVIAEMDTSLDDARLLQAETAVRQAEAQLALLKAGAPPAELGVLRAALEQARAEAAAARTIAQDAQALVNAPGTLDVEIAGTQFALQAAAEQLKSAQANATAADLEEQLLGRTVNSLEEGFDVGIPGYGVAHFKTPSEKLEEARLQWNLASQKQWQAHAQVDIASAELQSVRKNLADLRSRKADPISLQAQANAAEAAARVAEAAVTTAGANLDVALAGAVPERIQGAESIVAQAEAGVRAVQARVAQARISAPQPSETGEVKAPWTISTVVLRDGEVASPGSPIVHLAELDRVTLTVYVAEPDLGRVRLGQEVQVVVDSYPAQRFLGSVTQIANEAEFTPKNVETRDERVNTVYAVKIDLHNPDGALKPGMPADATFCAEGATGCAGTAAAEESSGLKLPQLSISVNPTPGPIQASGSIEGTETTISSEVSGRVVEAGGTEGGSVGAEQVLVRLDGSELEAQYQQAEAERDAARAELARVLAAPQPAKVAQAQAQVAQAEAALAAARSGLADAQSLRDNPQELDAQIDNTRAQIDTAAAQLDLANASLKAAQVLQASLPEGIGSDQDKTQRAIYDQQVLAAEAAVKAAEAQRQGAQATLTQLGSIRDRPVALDAAVHKAEGQVAQAEAARGVAQSFLAQVEAPAQPEAIAVARARVDQADANQAALAATLDKLALSSPVTGTITAQTIHAGEVAQPGAPLYTIVDLEHVKLVIFVSEGRIGQVKVGQQAQVSTDAYPGRLFNGTVTHISDQAEFTPKNVQTKEERVKMVFRVEIALDNSDGALKPGMPADAVLVE
jgi:HlyD family secretion protein